ncbi:MAG TPA: Calx-beta domain-containing protein, partial [Tepidisphaeraceae bacterium]|nr:Calx-beta domain-containing protein [Tepidisphaeraceae bacterium]
MTQGDQGFSRCRNQCSSRRPGAKVRRRCHDNRPVSPRYMAEPLEQRLLLAVLYVDLNATGPLHDGSSWDSAYVDLQPALIQAQAGDQIRIADGTYKPTAGTDRAQLFQMKNGVSLYGGYAGYKAANPDQRDIQLFPTILSGEIGDPKTVEDNSYHVVYASRVDATAILDGLTITAGYAAYGSSGYGGGMYNYSSSPTLTNCTFSGNSAGMCGGGMYNFYSSPTLANCIFSGNSTILDGIDVPATPAGGGMCNEDNSSPTLVNCTFSGNSAYDGGGIYGLSATLVNCILWGNTRKGLAGGRQSQLAGFADITHSLIQGGWEGTGNLDADPQFLRPPDPGPDGKWATADDDYGDLRLRSTSPALNAGRNDALPAGTTHDLAGNPRIHDGIVDLGAYEAEDWPAAVTFTSSAQEFSEDAGILTLTLNLSQPLERPVTVPLLLSGNAALGSDYRLLSPNPILFEPGSTSASCQIEILDDSRYELSESLMLQLGEVTGAWYGSLVTHIITLKDDDEPPVLHVDDTATGSNDGSSWADAYTSLQAALQAVEVGAVIWVAAGTYKPGTLRADSFQLRNRVAIFGGFPDGGGAWLQRDPSANPTILSGEIGDPTTTSDNSSHVVYARNVDATAILDGVTITAGNANGSSEYLANEYFCNNRYGGGMYNFAASPILRNCIFIANMAASFGGAIYNAYASAPTLTDCTFTRNTATSTLGRGGAVYNDSSSPTLINCTFNGNSCNGLANAGGGAMYSDWTGSRPKLVNCTFVANTAIDRGGAVFTYEGETTLTNCTFAWNSATGVDGSGGAVHNSYFPSTLVNCILWGNTAATGPQINMGGTVSYSDIQGGWSGIGNLNADPRFVRNPSPGPDGKWGTADDDYGDLRLCSTSPAINTGSNAAVPTDITTDLTGNSRLIGSRVDLGAFEAPDRPVTVTFAASAQQVSEPGGILTLTLNLSQPLTTAVTVPLLLGGTATPDRDYRLLSPNPLVFEPGSTSLSFEIEILDDRRCDPDETVMVHLGELTGAWYGAVATHTITIVNDDEPPVLYVDDTATGANNGSSWSDAYTSLQAALQLLEGDGAAIWVATGTYKPGSLRTDSFQLRNHVAIYGGFPEGG